MCIGGVLTKLAALAMDCSDIYRCTVEFARDDAGSVDHKQDVSPCVGDRDLLACCPFEPSCLPNLFYA